MRSVEHDWLRRMLWGCTFDDFLNPPGWGIAESRKGISLASCFSANIKLNLPIISANMDTITGTRMAVAIAKEGGIGVIHRYLGIDDQSEKVKEVKREENFIIVEPYCISPSVSVSEARNFMEKNKVGGLVVIDENDRLLGVLSKRDIRFCSGSELVESRMTASTKLITAKISDTSLAYARSLMDVR